MQTFEYKTGNGIIPADLDMRGLIFSRLNPASRCLWDLGAGSGQIAIEWHKLHPDCRVYAIEKDDACVQAIREAVIANETPRVTVIHRDATADMADLALPDAIYHGCVSWTDFNLCPVLWDYLAPGGTIVAVVGQERGRGYIHEAQRLFGGEIAWAGSGAGRFQFWAATKPIINPQSIEETAARDPHRICPLLAAPGIARGDTLALRLAGETVKLRAPRQYLDKLFDWCQGDMTLAEIEEACVARWGDSRFIRFVDDLFDAGILIDTSMIVQHAVRAAHFSNWMGRPADKAAWRAAQRPLPVHVAADASTVTLAPAAPSALADLLAQRRSADAFADRPLASDTLFRVLHAAYGMQATGHRSVGSAGGYYGLQLHAILLKDTDGVAHGTYCVHFDARGGVHLQRKHDESKHLPSFVYHPHMLRHAAALLVVSADLRPSTLKYGNRSYPFALIEAGAIVQNVALAAAEQRIGWRVLGGFESARIAECCRLNETDHVLITGVLGMLPEEEGGDKRGASAGVEFLWSDDVPDLPFHLAMARLETDSKVGTQEFSWGRDVSAWRAYDKAVAEATERHAYRQPRPLRSARWEANTCMCDPRTLIAYTRAQYARADFPFKPFDSATSYLWVEARHMTHGEARWVPAECVLHRTALPDDYLGGCLTSSFSSGCASGTTVAMAQQSALFELIERDAFMRHWFAQRGGLGVDVNSLPFAFKHRIDDLRAKGCRISVQVLDLGVQPVWMVVIQHDDKHFTAVGAAAGLDIERVLHSALSEAETSAYVRLTGIEPDSIHPSDVKTPAQHADLYAQRRYYRRADALFETIGEGSFDDMMRRRADDMDIVYADLAARGMEALWVDLSLPDAPLTLAGERLVSGRMLVPGLIPIAFGAQNMPYGMSTVVHPRARFPHPFP